MCGVGVQQRVGRWRAVCVFVCRGKRLAARETDFSSLPCLTTFGSSRPGMEPMHPVKVHETLKHSLNHWTTTKSRETLILKMKSLDFTALPESRPGAVASSNELWGGALFPGSSRFTTFRKPASLPAKQTLLRSPVPQRPPVGN